MATLSATPHYHHSSSQRRHQRDHTLELEYGNTFTAWTGPTRFVEGRARTVKAGMSEEMGKSGRNGRLAGAGAASQPITERKTLIEEGRASGPGDQPRLERTGSLLIEDIVEQITSLPSPSSFPANPQPSLPDTHPTAQGASLPQTQGQKLLIEQVIDLTISSPATTPTSKKGRSKTTTSTLPAVNATSPIRPRAIPLYADKICYEAMTPPKPRHKLDPSTQASTSSARNPQTLKPIHPFFGPPSTDSHPPQPFPSSSYPNPRQISTLGTRPPPQRNVPRMSARMLQTSSMESGSTSASGGTITSSQETESIYTGTETETGTASASQESRSSSGEVEDSLGGDGYSVSIRRGSGEQEAKGEPSGKGKDLIAEAGLEDVLDALHLDALAEVGRTARKGKTKMEDEGRESDWLSRETREKGKNKLDARGLDPLPGPKLGKPMLEGRGGKQSALTTMGVKVERAKAEQGSVKDELKEVEAALTSMPTEGSSRVADWEADLSDGEVETSLVEEVEESEEEEEVYEGEQPAQPSIPPGERSAYRTKASDAAEALSLPFFSYKTYSPNLPISQQHGPTVSRPTSRPPHLVYTDDRDEASDLLDLLKGDVYGFDLEWPTRWARAVGQKGSTLVEGRTALVQVCDDKVILLIHLARMKGFPTRLREIIRDEKKLKLGVNIRGDGQKLRKDFPGLAPHGLFELSWLARQVEPGVWGPGYALVALARLTQRYTGYAMYKGNDVRQSSWEKTLGEEQREYAGNDVFASVMIYNRLMEMAAENGIKVNQRMCLVEEGATSRQTVTVQKERVVSGDTLAKSLRSFMMFAMGDDLETIGKAMRSPEQPLAPGTIRQYLFRAISSDPTLKIKDKPRFYHALSPGRRESYNRDNPGYMELLARLEREISPASTPQVRQD